MFLKLTDSDGGKCVLVNLNYVKKISALTDTTCIKFTSSKGETDELIVQESIEQIDSLINPKAKPKAKAK